MCQPVTVPSAKALAFNGTSPYSYSFPVSTNNISLQFYNGIAFLSLLQPMDRHLPMHQTNQTSLCSYNRYMLQTACCSCTLLQIQHQAYLMKKSACSSSCSMRRKDLPVCSCIVYRFWFLHLLRQNWNPTTRSNPNT